MWQNHHAIFRLVRRVDRRTVFLNLLLLAGTAFIPFATSVLGSYPTFHASTFLYGLALSATATAFNLLLAHLIRSQAFADGVSRTTVAATVRAYRIGWRLTSARPCWPSGCRWSALPRIWASLCTTSSRAVSTRTSRKCLPIRQTAREPPTGRPAAAGRPADRVVQPGLEGTTVASADPAPAVEHHASRPAGWRRAHCERRLRTPGRQRVESWHCKERLDDEDEIPAIRVPLRISSRSFY